MLPRRCILPEDHDGPCLSERRRRRPWLLELVEVPRWRLLLLEVAAFAGAIGFILRWL